MVPCIIIGYGMNAHIAVCTSLFVIVFTSISSSLASSSKKTFDFKTSILLPCGTIPGLILGAYSTQYISSS